MLLLKGRQEYQETMNVWKQTDHVMGTLLLPQDRPQRTFLQKFYEGEYTFVHLLCILNYLFLPGRDEEAVLPAASGM